MFTQFQKKIDSEKEMMCGGVLWFCYYFSAGARIAQWLERQTRDRTVPGSSPRRRGGRIFFSMASRVNFLCWLLFRYPFHPMLPQKHVKNPGHSAKSAGGRLQLNTHAPYLCGFEWRDTVNWCMIEWCTQNLHRDGSSFTWHHQNPVSYTHLTLPTKVNV